ncbi:hypothetical protein BKA62DRAFT_40223 [Auriculariales sp. MPI-PUGE-AT-0066]|nr:hypothetical protein BKA62DRAFT_40223 [Auriculariales sp. MPI-PUGE-AT-0066]
MTTALRPLQLVDGPVSPGPLTAPYGNVGSPLAARHPNRRLSLQLQSTTVPPSRFGTSTTPSSPAPSGVHLKRHSSQSQYQHHRQQRDPSAPLSPPVLTLAERHADLLRFIAQKESKCLELRQQLAQHEADLLAMKRKWERIVARGSGSSTSAGLPLSPGPGAGTSHRTSTDSTVSMDSIASGLKDGVGRVLQFSGFGDMFPAAGTVDESVPELSHAASSAVARARKHDRLSLSGSSISTASLISEADPDAERDDADGDDSHPPTPSEELLIDIDSDAFAPLKTPTSITPHRRAATLPSSSPLSPLPLHSGALAGLVNRKWEELRGTETLQKSQKRASALFTDVFNALVPPITPRPRLRLRRRHLRLARLVARRNRWPR